MMDEKYIIFVIILIALWAFVIGYNMGLDKYRPWYVANHVCFKGSYIFKGNYDFDGNNLEYRTLCYEIMNYTYLHSLPADITHKVSGSSN